jgi:hypothetical protein
MKCKYFVLIKFYNNFYRKYLSKLDINNEKIIIVKLEAISDVPIILKYILKYKISGISRFKNNKIAADVNAFLAFKILVITLNII